MHVFKYYFVAVASTGGLGMKLAWTDAWVRDSSAHTAYIYQGRLWRQTFYFSVRDGKLQLRYALELLLTKQVRYFISKNQPGLQHPDPFKSSPGRHFLLQTL